VLLSSYALYVEHKVAHKAAEEEFSALCDIEVIGASCRYVTDIFILFSLTYVNSSLQLIASSFLDSSVFQLPEGRMLSYFGIIPNDHMLDVPNAALGLVFYLVWLVLLPKFPKLLTFVVVSLAMLSSVFLAIQLMLLKELCILCWSTHAINARLWWNAFSTIREESSSAARASDGKAKIKRV
jgi:hypothetical protein